MSGGGDLFAGGALGTQGLLLPPERSLDAVGLIPVQLIGPLRHGRRADAAGTGRRGDGATKHVNCRFLLHEPDISRLTAKGKHPNRAYWENKFTMKTLKERTEAAIAAGYSVGQLAIAAGKSSSAVSQWRSGLVESLKADSASGLSKLTGWSVDWWATGNGPQVSENPSSTVRPYSVTNHNVAPVFEWAKLGEVLFTESSNLTAGEHMEAPASASLRFKWFVADADMPRLRIRHGWRVAIEPVWDDSKCQDGDTCLFRTSGGAFFLGDFRRIAGGYEAIPDSGLPLDTSRHGIKVVGEFHGAMR